jgi:hypothetical protein
MMNIKLPMNISMTPWKLKEQKRSEMSFIYWRLGLVFSGVEPSSSEDSRDLEPSDEHRASL